ncbi:tripartite tricarboxylate transporter substrate binding protein BugE [Variovorax defluvii]|uniref:Tripartite tricarboxylate transporter substrate binding protein BugE n=1 Tax=Variovorax defluvii TaxID=913761 RepID=A0ABP8I929_9BURK
MQIGGPLSRRKALAGIGALCLASTAQAEGFGSKPIRILVGFSAGGSTDALARIYAAKLGEILNTSVIVENKPGAMQLLAARPVMAAPPDGYTLWVTSSSALSQTPGVRKDLPYDPLKNFTPLAEMADAEAVFVVRAETGLTSVREVVAFARDKPGKLNYGSAGVGSANHLLTEYFKVLTGTNLTHIPYKSDPDVVREVIGGSVDVAIVVANAVLAHAQNPKLRLLGVTGSQPLAAIPDVPLLTQSGVKELRELGTYLFYGILGPSGMPQALVQTLNEAVVQASKSPDVVAKLEKQFFKPTGSTPAEFRQHIERDLAIWKRVGANVKLTEGNT